MSLRTILGRCQRVASSATDKYCLEVYLKVLSLVEVVRRERLMRGVLSLNELPSALLKAAKVCPRCWRRAELVVWSGPAATILMATRWQIWFSLVSMAVLWGLGMCLPSESVRPSASL